MPLDPQTVDEFDPSTALNLDDLNNGNNGLSLFKVFLNDFEAFIKKCEDSQKRDSNMLKDLRESTLDF